MLNRTTAPAFQELKKFEPIQVQKEFLQNNVPVYLLKSDTQALLRIEFIFKAGNWYNPAVGVAATTARMMTQGTLDYSSFEISEMVSKYGAHLSVTNTSDHLKISLFTLTKYLKEVLPIVKEVLLNASFPESELSILKENMLQGFRLNLEKTSYIASQLFKRTLFGENHSYTDETTLDSIDNLSTDLLKEFFQKHIVNKEFDIVVAGSVPSKFIELLDQEFGKLPINKSQIITNHQLITSLEKSHYIEKKDALQTNIKIGCKSIPRKHEDCFDFVVLNEIIGGFFGSRLMKNLREDKGYTYGINSSFLHLLNVDFWLISTDVKKEFKDDALNQIYKELEILQNELISDKELELVKNNLLGSFCSSVNTCFDLADRFKIMLHQDLDNEYYQRYIQNLRGIDANKVQEMAQKYLIKDDFIEITVG